MKISRIITIAVVSAALILMPLLASCGPTYVGRVGSNVGNRMQASYQLFNGTEEKKIWVPITYGLTFDFKSAVEAGSLKMQLLSPEKNLLLDIEPNTSGSHMFLADKTGNFYLIVTGNNTKGSYDFTWEIKYSGS